MQNRLEHTIANLGVYQENLSAAESRIRDVDVAQEMVNLTGCRSSRSPAPRCWRRRTSRSQGVLSLLRG